MPRMPRRRGAALVEFALVGPIFILMLFMIIQISVWAFDREALMVASRTGARAAVLGTALVTDYEPGAAEVSRIIGSKVEAVTPSLPAAIASRVFATPGSGPCFRSRNTPNATVHARLAWDWGCDPASEPLLRAALSNGIRAAYEQLHGSRAVWIGPHGDATIRACYIVVTPGSGAEACVYELTATVNSRGELGLITGGFTGSLTTTPAPSLVRVSIKSSAPTLVGAQLLGVDSLALSGAGGFWIDRFRPPCPDLLTGNQYLTGACGGVH
jgi:Flp pilus assembly protein TadG